MEWAVGVILASGLSVAESSPKVSPKVQKVPVTPRYSFHTQQTKAKSQKPVKVLCPTVAEEATADNLLKQVNWYVKAAKYG